MTIRTTARPTTGAGPHPDRTNTVANYRTYERTFAAITTGRISRNPKTYEYVDSLNRFQDVDQTVYDMADRGWLTLHRDGRIEVTAAGRAWLVRDRQPGKHTPQFSDAGSVA